MDSVHHLHTPADEAASLHVGVHVHRPVLMKFMAEVGCVSHPGKGLVIEHQDDWLPEVCLLPDHEYRLRLCLSRIWITGELKIVAATKVCRKIKHLLHRRAMRSEE